MLWWRLERTSLIYYYPTMPFENRKKIEDLFSSVLSQVKKYPPPVNLKFGYLSLVQSLKLRISMEKILSISLVNITPRRRNEDGKLKSI